MDWLLRKAKSFVEEDHTQQIENENSKQAMHLKELCNAFNAEDVHDLKHILCSLVLSECVYKTDEAEMIEALNQFKGDFGGQLVNIKHVQPCLDHVPHRYLLAESGDTLYAVFIGTKKYRDYVTNARILQEAIFQQEISEDAQPVSETIQSTKENNQMLSNDEQVGSKHSRSFIQQKPQKNGFKPAAHQGFLARAKGIPSMELCRLALERKQKLVFCGHSLGGAVAVLAMVPILRGMPAEFNTDGGSWLKCITFSQPPVGNAALKEFIHNHGWQRQFRTYCIPEDVIPRLLSPYYFQLYFQQLPETNSSNSLSRAPSKNSANSLDERGLTLPELSSSGCGEPLLGGSVQKYIYRLSRLVPLAGVQKQVDASGSKMGNRSYSQREDGSKPNLNDIYYQQAIENKGRVDVPPLPSKADKPLPTVSEKIVHVNEDVRSGQILHTSTIPLLPVYVPFGKLFLLEKSSVKSLSAPAFTSLTSVETFLMEMKERFPSHSMKAYRDRFYRMYKSCISNLDIDFRMSHTEKHFLLNQLFEGAGPENVKIGAIMKSHKILTAVSVAPLDLNGIWKQNSSQNIKIDLYGYGLHMCTSIQVLVNGCWCSVTQDPFFPQGIATRMRDPNLRGIRIQVSGRITEPQTKKSAVEVSDPNTTVFYNGKSDGKTNNTTPALQDTLFQESLDFESTGMRDLICHCSSDFITVTKKVFMRVRRVQLLGLEGSGKTSLYNALIGKSIVTTSTSQEAFGKGVTIIDSAGVDLQDLRGEAIRLKQNLTVRQGELNRKIDLVILVHNLSHKIPSSTSHPSLKVLLDVIDMAGIPWILAIVNKFSVSADRFKSAISGVLQSYQVPPHMFAIVNSCDYVVHGSGINSWNEDGATSEELNGSNKFRGTVQRIISGFKKKAVVLPVEGIDNLWSLIHQVLISKEESAFQELAIEKLLIEQEKERRPKMSDKSSVISTSLSTLTTRGLAIMTGIAKLAVSPFKKP